MPKPRTTKDLSSKEVALIVALRTRFTHGVVEITMRDGTPQHIRRAWENDALETAG